MQTKLQIERAFHYQKRFYHNIWQRYSHLIIRHVPRYCQLSTDKPAERAAALAAARVLLPEKLLLSMPALDNKVLIQREILSLDASRNGF